MMATSKQIGLRIKYAKATINTLTKKLNAGKAKLKKLEGEVKKAKVAEKKTVKKVVKKVVKKPVRKTVSAKKAATAKKR
ncbi:MAG: hypothetical protein JXD19_02060 [Deltaproteobacteria bacterium]|nr:hypothetical protein [Deltaproteobacteria bacterium]